MDNLINYNGTVLKSAELFLSPDNRGFSFGDGFFESILVIAGSIPLWSYHLDRIKRSADILHFNTENIFTDEMLQIELAKIVPVKGIFRVKLSIFRVSSGKYLPDSNDIQFLIQVFPANTPMQYAEGHNLSIGRSYKVYNSDAGAWKQVKSLSALPYVIASMEAKQAGFEDVLILTKSGQISESTNSNVFVIKGNRIFTPVIQTGCVNGVFRQYLFQFLSQKGMEIIENDLFWAEIEKVDELFLTNAIQWIRPVTKVPYQYLGENRMTQKIIKMVRQDLLKM
ncbi:MAG: aminotransferase class IV [Saprospiraceae bacterium]|nr:aminotransferase class IV [Saprospiraceae bacterium]